MTQRLDTLQLFRGLAAIGVVLYHAANATNAFMAEPIPQALQVVLRHGYLGVDFFFVLSGFIILNSHQGDARNLAMARSYFLKRLIRIFPPYLPVSIVLLVSYAALPTLSAGTRGEISLLSSLLLLPSAYPPALTIAWTLLHEMLFYVVFLAFYVGSVAFSVVMFLWLAAIVLANATHGIETLAPLFKVLLDPINLEFMMGMGCAWLWRRLPGGRRAGHLAAAGGVALFLVLVPMVPIEWRFLFGIPFALIVLGGVTLDRTGSILVPRRLILLGDASYSIYLIHYPLLSLTSRMMRLLGGYSSWWLTLSAGVVLSLVFGILYHRIVEIPSLRFLRRRFLSPAR